MKSNITDDKKFLGTFIRVIISIFKWLCLILFVLNIGLTISLFVMILMEGANIPNDLIVTMLGYLSYLNETQILDFVVQIGKVRVVVAGLGYGIASSITYGLAYNIMDKFQNIFKSIISGEMFTKENVKILNNTLPLTCLLAFAQPVIISIIIATLHVFQLSDINVSGITFIIATFILKLTFESGYDLASKNTLINRELSDVKAQESENQIAELKRQLALKKSHQNEAPKKNNLQATETKAKKNPTKKRYTKKATTK